MVQIEMLEDAEGYEKGQTVSLDNNDAHRLIDGGKAQLKYTTRIMEPDQGGFVAPKATPAPAEPVHTEEPEATPTVDEPDADNA